MTNPYTGTISGGFKTLAATDASTVVAEYTPLPRTATERQSESAMENELIDTLVSQGYGRSAVKDEKSLVANLRGHVERLNQVTFSDKEWGRLLTEFIAKPTDTVLDKTRRVQHERALYTFRFDDGHLHNIALIDFENPHNNVFEVMNQYKVTTEDGARRTNRYDVTILLNGLPMVHIELKQRGVSLSQAFNQIRRYDSESFSSGHGLFGYVHVFVISNGSQTKYYSNTTRLRQLKDTSNGKGRTVKTSNSFEFTMYWADAKNKRIEDITDFSRTFFARRTLFNLVARFCVLDTNDTLLIMRPYQVVATERILNKIKANINNPKMLGTRDARGYIWHTTGSGKTLTSFKTAQLATDLPEVAKVVFVVDRQDLDYQTMKEYDKFSKGAANSNSSTAKLKEQLGDDTSKIIITTIQKLNYLTSQKEKLPIYGKHVVFIFDECHRSQFGAMHKQIQRTFTKTSMFGFTGTPIFHTPEDEAKRKNKKLPVVETTEQVFGAQLHTYTIVNAIADGNVLKFNVQHNSTIESAVQQDLEVAGIDREKALLAPKRISAIVSDILNNHGKYTCQTSVFSHTVQDYDPTAYKAGRDSERTVKQVQGFNAMLATSSITAAKAYYTEFTEQMKGRLPKDRLKIATIFSTPSTESERSDIEFVDEEDMSTDAMSTDDRTFLEAAVADYNQMFGCAFDIKDQQGFQNYYRDLSQRVKNREVDLVIVVNMFLTGFDATTLNTLYVDKNLRRHGLVQAYSRTNRILNTYKPVGNIVCYRNLEEQLQEAMQRFGDSDAYNVVVLKPYSHYLDEYHTAVAELKKKCPPGTRPFGEAAENDFIKRFTNLIRLVNLLDLFPEFGDDTCLSKRDMQDYQSIYLSLHESRTKPNGELVDVVDDLEFDIRLISKFSVGVDYIINLVLDMHKKRGELTEEDRKEIEHEIKSSPELRLKSDLIDAFIEQLQGDSAPSDFYDLALQRFEDDLDTLIAEFNLKPEETRRFVARGLADQGVSTSGMGPASIMPPVRRFGRRSVEDWVSKRVVIGKINEIIQHYSGVIETSSLTDSAVVSSEQ